MRAEPASPTEVKRALSCLGAGGGGGTEGKELRGAGDEEKEEAEEKNGTLCVLLTLGQAASGKWKE